MDRRSRFPSLSRTASGSFVVRKRIPPGLRAAAKALHGVAHEGIEPLRTDDRAQAGRLYPGALARIRAKLDDATTAARRSHQGPTASAQADGVAGRGGREHPGDQGAAPQGGPPPDPAAMLAAIGAWEAAETRRHVEAILAGGTPHPHDGQKAAEAGPERMRPQSEEICELTGLDFVWKPPPREKLLEFDRAIVEALAGGTLHI